VIAAHDQQEWIVKQPDALERIIVTDRAAVVAGAHRPHVEVEDHRQVELARLQSRGALIRLSIKELQPDDRVLLSKPLQGLRRKGRRGTRKRAQAQPPPSPVGDRLKLALGQSQSREHDIGVRQQSLSSVGKPSATMASLEQDRSRAALERRHLLRNGRRREVQRISRSRETTQLRGALQRQQMPGLKHPASR